MTNPNMMELNQGDDFIFLIDVSASMGATDTPTGQTRYDFAKEKAKAFCHEASKIDTDGISIYRFGHNVTRFSDITEDKIDGVFNDGPNEMSTDTAAAIQAAYEEHLARKNDQTFVLIVTDGAPNNEKAVQDVIVNITNQVKDEREFNIGFLQVTTAQQPHSFPPLMTTSKAKALSMTSLTQNALKTYLSWPQLQVQ